MATQAQIEELKRQWATDPCWDIEITSGFEEHRDELAAFRAEQERIAAERENDRLLARAAHYGCPGNAALAAHLERLEMRIDDLEYRLAREANRETDR